MAARVSPETGYERGGGTKYAFTFNCSDLAALKDSLATVSGGERKAAFRYQATNIDVASLFSMDFGFNRRSSGPNSRPRLLLFTGTNYPTGEGCDANAPAPVIEEIGIQDGLGGRLDDGHVEDGQRLVRLVRPVPRAGHDRVDAGRDSRPHAPASGAGAGIGLVQVSTSSSSAPRACNGATTTDSNGGAGYDFYRHVPRSRPARPTRDDVRLRNRPPRAG